MRANNSAPSEMQCDVCGAMQTITRNTGRQRSKGHKKKLWCICCKEEVNHTEIRYKDWNGKTLADVCESQNIL